MSDLISRQDAIDAINERIKAAYEWYDKTPTNDIKVRAEQAIATFCEASLTIKKLPSAQKTGRWITQEGYDGDEYYECSVCQEAFVLIDGTPNENGYNYCPACGARLVEGEENE